ncbi:MAG: xanthine/uracil/vitamin C permease, partial [Gammaproteobacteria bacterium]|nr:xanthine/uracil/vitamin C permease [Gammaproteobacteria bacterium]
MALPAARSGPEVRFEPDEKPGLPVTVGLALQYCLLTVGPIVLTVAIVVRAAGESELFLSWAACAALLVSGIATMVQARRVGRLGAGYILLMGTSGAFIAVSVTALVQGGPALLATLVAVSALFQFALASRMSLLRRIITPTVAGTVIMLIAVTVMPLILDLIAQVPEGVAPAAGPVTAAVTLAVTMAIVLRASGAMRLWGPVIGIVAGSVVAGFFGMFSWDAVATAPWFGLPLAGWPGFDFSFGPVFWALLPAFVFVTLVGAIETIGDAVAVQRVSWRKDRATDFRGVQGAVMADGLGNLLSGLLATVPNTTYS